MNAVQKISNHKLEQSALDKYTLSIDLRIDGLSFLVSDEHNDVHMERFDWLNSADWDNTYKNLSKLLSEHDILKLNFQKLNVIIQSPNTLLIPKSLFNSNRIDKIYNTYFNIDNHEIFHSLVSGIKNNSIMVFGLENRISRILRSKFSNIQWSHFSISFIDTCLKESDNKDKIHLKFQMNYFEVVALRNGDLESHNYFYFNTAEDFIFKLLSFARQIGFNLETLSIVLGGKITSSSALHLLMKKYIADVSFTEEVDQVSTSAFYDLIEVSKYANS